MEQALLDEQSKLQARCLLAACSECCEAAASILDEALTSVRPTA